MEAKPKAKLKFPAIFSAKISLGDQVLLAKHLSMMLKSGISEVESLRIIREQTKNKKFGEVLDKIVQNVENGQFLSESLAQFKNTFGELFINITKLGEISGTLPENLDYLSEEIKKKAELNSKIKAAMVYPMIVLTATLGVTGVLILFVLPKILPVFTQLNVKLPITTRILVGTADFVGQHYILLMAGMVALVVAWRLLLRLYPVRYFANRLILLLPIVGKISKEYNMANISRTLGLLLKSGVKIVEALSATSNSITNLVYKRALLDAVEEAKKGATLYKYLDTMPNLFPSTLSRMIQIGERTGNLDNNLVYLSQFYENELNEKVKNLSSILEPILMVVMGLVVGFVAIAIITPIYEITQNINVKK